MKARSVSFAASQTQVERRTFYMWRDGMGGRYPNAVVEGFAEAWDEALEVGIQFLEDEAVRRAAEGVEKPIFYQGEQVASVTEYSDNLLKFLLEGRRATIYRPKQDDKGVSEIKITVTGGLPE